MNDDRVFLVDASIYVCRAWFGLPVTLTDDNGQPINAVYGFLDFATRLLTQCRPARIAFVFDGPLRGSFRNRIYPAYKINRPPAPPELKRQFLQCREVVRALGCPIFQSDAYEADDLIGALTVAARAQGYACVIVSGDKDLTQLIRERDVWWDFARDVKLDAKGVERRFGVAPAQIAELLAIAGDKVDNIPGVPGIGLTTAARLLRRFNTLENLLQNTALIKTMKMRGAARVQGLIELHRATLTLAHRLTYIDCMAPLPDPLELARTGGDLRIESLFDKLARMRRHDDAHTSTTAASP